MIRSGYWMPYGEKESMPEFLLEKVRIIRQVVLDALYYIQHGGQYEYK